MTLEGATSTAKNAAIRFGVPFVVFHMPGFPANEYAVIGEDRGLPDNATIVTRFFSACGETPTATEPPQRREPRELVLMARHRWLKLRLHAYICTKCGTGKVNSCDAGGWSVTYHLPDGTSHVSPRVPACAPGPRTAQYLARHESAIAVGGMNA